MSRQLDELLGILASLIQEHRKLLAEAERHQTAVKAVDVPSMESSRLRQEAIRQKIAALENQRRAVSAPLGAGITLTRLAELHPDYRTRLLTTRDQLRAVIEQITQRTNVTGRVAHAVLGHLNSVVRLFSGAVQQAGVYTKQGVPKLSARLGVMEAVG